MDRKLASLKAPFKSKVDKFLALTVEAGIPVMIIQTSRTPEEHAANLAAGRSWIKHSKHLDGLAIDICPYAVYDLKGPDKLQWDSKDPVWLVLGLIGESCGMTWGGRWTVRDMGHFEEKP